MAYGDVRFLNALRVLRGNIQKQVNFISERATGFTGESHDIGLAKFSGGDAANDIWAEATGREGYENVLWSYQGFDLAGEDALSYFRTWMMPTVELLNRFGWSTRADLEHTLQDEHRRVAAQEGGE